MSDRLSAQDAAFLYGESAVAHMHVGSLVVFEEMDFDEERLREHIGERLHLVPRFRKKLAWVPGSLGRPVWVDDADFDLRYHIRQTGLPEPGGMEEAQKLMARVMSVRLDRRRPLWEMWLFRFGDGRVGMVQKTHHSLIDGVSGVDVGTVMLDMGPEPVRIQSEPFEPQPAPSGRQLMTEAVVDAVRQPNRFLADWLRRSSEDTGELTNQAKTLAKGLLSFGKASLDLAPRTPLSAPIGPHRRFETLRCELDALKRIKRRFECTVNDVVLAVVAGALGGLLRSRGERIDGLVMKAMVPVSFRDASQRMTYGNKVSMMAAELPVGETDAAERLQFVRQRMQGLKESKQAVGADFWIKLSEYAPPTVLALAARATAMQRMVNIVVTNVPGPQFPLYLRGGRMEEVYPCAPILGNAALGIAVLSYDGGVHFGLNGDWDVLPDLKVLAGELKRSLEELEALV